MTPPTIASAITDPAIPTSGFHPEDLVLDRPGRFRGDGAASYSTMSSGMADAGAAGTGVVAARVLRAGVAGSGVATGIADATAACGRVGCRDAASAERNFWS